MTSPVAILGASGFIGSRVVEMFHLGGIAEVRPVVRQIASLARSARFALDGRVADATDRRSIRQALEGCDVAVHAIAGDTAAILDTIEPIYTAAQDAGVRRVVYLSTASVHGQAPPPGTDESTPLSDRQPIPYNNAKVRAERRFHQLRASGTVEVVMLRPGIVWGPRSTWVGQFADELLTGTAYVVEGAAGICNSIYVDNLVQAIELALKTPGLDGQVFLVGDEEHVTWRDLYEPIANAFGVAFDQIPSIDWTGNARSGMDRLVAFRDSRMVQAVLPLVPLRVRYAAFNGLAAWVQYDPSSSAFDAPQDEPPTPDLERALLHRCTWRLPWSKARSVLGYTPTVPFAEGCRRSIEWLAFAGYPVGDARW